MKKQVKLLISLLAVAMIVSMFPLSAFAANPYLPLWERVPDGEPHIFTDPDDPTKERIYVYGSIDGQDPGTFCGWYHVVWSAPVEDPNDWRYEGVSFDRDWLNGLPDENGEPYKVIFSAELFAPDAIYNPVTGKYYQYAFISEVYDSPLPPGELPGQSVSRVWVGVSDRPAGPFNDEIYFVDAGWYPSDHEEYPGYPHNFYHAIDRDTGENVGWVNSRTTNAVLNAKNVNRGAVEKYIPPHGTPISTAAPAGNLGGFDPAVYVETEYDADGTPISYKAYIYWGFSDSGAWCAELYNGGEVGPSDRYAARPGTTGPIPMASVNHNSINGNDGLLINGIDANGNLFEHSFFEASSIRKVNDDTYVMVYSMRQGANLAYATSDNPLGPFIARGIVHSSLGVEGAPNPYGNNQNTYRGGNNHGGLAFINDQWWIFGHRHNGSQHEAHYYERWTTAAHRQGVAEPVGLPFEVNHSQQTIDAIANASFISLTKPLLGTSVDKPLYFKKAEFTSMGFETNGLDPFKKYDAAIECYQMPNSNGQAFVRARNTNDNQDWLDRTQLPDLAVGDGYLYDWNPVVIRNNGSVRLGYRYFNFGEGIPAGAELKLHLTMGVTPLAAGRTINIYVGDMNGTGLASGESAHTLIGTATIDEHVQLTQRDITPTIGNRIGQTAAQWMPTRSNLQEINDTPFVINIDQNLDKLVGKKAIYIEFIRGVTTTNAVGNDVVDLNKIQFVLDSDLALTTAAHNIKAGDYFSVNASFKEEQSSNTVVLNYAFDGNLFEYANYTPAAGVTVVDTQYGDGFAKISLMVPNYRAEDLGDMMLRAKEDAVLGRNTHTVSVDAEYVIKDAAGVKTINAASDAISFTTGSALEGDTNDDGVVDIIDLSNIIDWFGLDDSNPDWASKYTYFDFNNNGKIDIYDIAYVARLIV